MTQIGTKVFWKPRLTSSFIDFLSNKYLLNESSAQDTTSNRVIKQISTYNNLKYV